MNGDGELTADRSLLVVRGLVDRTQLLQEKI